MVKLCSDTKRGRERRVHRRAIMTIAVIAQSIGGHAAAGDEEERIRRLLLEAFDKPEARLVVEPVVIVGGHAIADWSQSQGGGRALLRQRAGEWVVLLCSGDGVTTAQGLMQMGVPGADAGALSLKLAEAEKAVAPDRLALFSTFEGTVLMDAGMHHEKPHDHPKSK